MADLDLAGILRALFALVFTLSLIGLAAWLVQRYGTGLMRGAKRTLPGHERLGITEWRLLDARHRLVLVRRDQTEHLILLTHGAPPVVVEHNIPPPAKAAP